MEKFDLLVKDALESVEMPIPSDAWEQFEAHREGEPQNKQVRSAFFLWKFAAAGAVLVASLATVNFQGETPESTQHTTSISQEHSTSDAQSSSTHSSDILVADHHTLSQDQNTSESLSGKAHKTSGEAHYSVETNSSDISNADKLDLNYSLQLAAAHLATASQDDLLATNKNIDSYSATNVTAKEKVQLSKLNKKLYEAAAADGKINGQGQNSDSDGLKVKSTTVYKGASFNLDAPSSFTPNGDGIMDEFMPNSLKNDDRFVLKVYDDNGNEIFKSKDVSKPWKGITNAGVTVPEGKYKWDVALIKDNKTSIFKGQVKLLRK